MMVKAGLLFFAVLLTGVVIGSKKITKIEFVPNTTEWNKGRDGIVQVLLKDDPSEKGEWSTVCLSGSHREQNNLAAKVFCYEMGFEHKGLGVYVSTKNVSGIRSLVWDIKCSLDPTDPTQHRIERCAFITGVHPTGCHPTDKIRLMAIACGQKRPAYMTTTSAPDKSTVPPINCSNQSKIVRLKDGTASHGRVEVFYNNSWGAICNNGFNRNEAKVICKLICKSAKYAQAITGNSIVGNAISHLSNLNCPANAASIDNCTHRGWGKAPGTCNAKTNAWVECAPKTDKVPKLYIPDVVCSEDEATVSFNRTGNEDLTNDMILLQPQKDYDKRKCDFKVTNTSTQIMVKFKFTQCGGLLNSTSKKTMYTNNLLRVYQTNDGLIFNANYTIPIVCEVPKINQGQSKQIRPVPGVVPPKIGKQGKVATTISLKLYKDKDFTEELKPNSTIILGTQIYVFVRETANLLDNQMSVRNCWATQVNSRTSLPRRDLVIEACPQAHVSLLESIDAMTQSFHFKVFLFQSDSQNQNIYVHCDTVTCHKDDTSPNCSRSCGGKKRVKREGGNLSDSYSKLSAGPKTVDNGPFYVRGFGNSATGMVASRSCLIAIWLICIMNFETSI